MIGYLRGAVRRALAVSFRAYRMALAPLIGPVCRYEPSCSHYAEQAITRFGFFHGAVLAAWRLLRCHPFSRGGLDPVPERRPPVTERLERAGTIRIRKGARAR